jgi:N-acetylmuramoyl-L-alanine amidase
MRKSCFYVLLLFILFACNKNPYKSTNKIYKKQVTVLTKQIAQTPLKDSGINEKNWVGTTNFNLRKPHYVIIHHTAQNSCEQTLKTFTSVASKVSAHYVICKDGTIHQMLSDYLRAWHGGVAKWGNNSDINSLSIGIEIDNNGFEKFTDHQIISLLTLLNKLKKNHSIPTANFIGHSDIAPSRKVDPNVHFPWKQLADKGFGNWFDDTTHVIIPDNFDSKLALKIIGYDVSNLPAAIAAFKRHFLQVDLSKELNDADKKILYAVMKKSL